MRSFKSVKQVYVFLLGAILFHMSCVQNSLEPVLNPQITNITDQFEFKITDVRSITQQLQYQWQNNGINANIHNFSNITEGSAFLTISDRVGDEVFSGNLDQTGDFFSSAGATGIWTIQLNMSNVSGTVHFRIERRP